MKRILKKLVNKYFKAKVVETESIYLKHEPTSFVNKNCMDFRIGSEKREYVSIGHKCIINSQFIFETQTGLIEIGNNVHIGSAIFICRTSIKVEDDVTMAWDIVLYDHDSHSTDWAYRKNDNNQCYDDYVKYNKNNIVNKDWSHVNSAPIHICSKVWIGFGVTVLKGVTIGEGAVIGAKSVVTKDIPPWSVAVGNPARVVRHLPKSE